MDVPSATCTKTLNGHTNHVITLIKLDDTYFTS